MSYKVIPTLTFEKELKRLSKKYPSLKEDLRFLINQLKENPNLGISLGKQRFKVRLKIKSKKQGKSGGGRVITYLIDKNKEIYLLSIYDKSELDTINDQKIQRIINSLKK